MITDKKEDSYYKAKPIKAGQWPHLVKEFEKEKEIPHGKAKFTDFCKWLINKGYAYSADRQAA